jgi:hypothetical protein
MQVYLKQGDKFFKVHYCQGTDTLNRLFEFDLRIGVFGSSDTCPGLESSAFITASIALKSNTLKNQAVTLILSESNNPTATTNLYFHARIAGVKANRLGAFSGTIISIKLKPKNWQGFANKTVRVFDRHETTENELNINVPGLSSTVFKGVVNRLVSHSPTYVTDFDFSSDVTALDLTALCGDWWQNLILFQYKESSESALMRLLDRSQLFYQYDYLSIDAKYILRKRSFTPNIIDANCITLNHNSSDQDIIDLDSDEALSVDYHFHDFYELDDSLQPSPAAELDDFGDETLKNSANTSAYDPDSQAVTQNQQLQPKYSGISHKVIGLNKNLKIVIETIPESIETLYCMPVSVTHTYDPSASISTTYQCEFESIYIKEGIEATPSLNIHWWFPTINERNQQLLATVKAASATSKVGDRDDKNRYLVQFEFEKGLLKPEAWLYRMRPYTGADGSGETYPLQAGSKVVLGFFQGNSDQPVILGSMALQDSNPGDVFPLIADGKGQLTTASQPVEGISSTNKSDQNDYIYQTENAEKYFWNEGNTYTFGGSRDYGYGNGYEVSIVEHNSAYGDGDFYYDMIKTTDSTAEFISDRSSDLKKDSGSDKYFLGISPPERFFRRHPDKTSSTPILDDLDNVLVAKTFGDTYEYQHGINYGITYSRWVHETSIVEDVTAYEMIENKYEESFVAIQSAQAYLGVDMAMDIKGLNLGLDITAGNFEVDVKLLNVEFSLHGVDVVYEKSLKKYELLETPEFRMSNENVQLDTSESLHQLAAKKIVLQADNSLVSAKPAAILGRTKAKSIAEWIPLVGQVIGAQDIMKYGALEEEVEAHIVKNGRADIESLSLARLELDQEASQSLWQTNKLTKTLIEWKLDSANQKAIFQLHKGNEDPTSKKAIISQYDYTSSLIEFKTKEADNKKQASLKLDSKTLIAGLVVEEDPAKKKANIDLSAKDSKTTMTAQVKTGEISKLELDAKNDKALLDVKKGSNSSAILMNNADGKGHWKSKKGADEFELSYTAGSKATLKLKDTSLELTATDSTLTGKSNVEIKAGSASVKGNDSSMVIKGAKVDIKAASGNVGIDGTAVEIKGKSKVELKAGSTTATLSAAGIDLKSTTVGVKGSGPVQIAGAIIKLG